MQEDNNSSESLSIYKYEKLHIHQYGLSYLIIAVKGVISLEAWQIESMSDACTLYCYTCIDTNEECRT